MPLRFYAVEMPKVQKADSTRLRVLRALTQRAGGRGVQELADELGLHANTVRFHLTRLLDQGMVVRESEERVEPGRPRLTFTAVPGSLAAVNEQRNYRLLAQILASFLAGNVPDPAAAAIEAGRVWGHYLAERPPPFRQTDVRTAIRRLLEVLDDVGFAPELAEIDGAKHSDAEQAADDQAGSDGLGGPDILLRHCPFLEVAREHREVACAVHLGLMQGVLAELRAPITTDHLEPFVEPALCIASVRPDLQATG